MTGAAYLEIARQAVRLLYVMTGRYTQYDADIVPDLDADEYEYVLTTARSASTGACRATSTGSSAIPPTR